MTTPLTVSSNRRDFNRLDPSAATPCNRREIELAVITPDVARSIEASRPPVLSNGLGVTYVTSTRFLESCPAPSLAALSALARYWASRTDGGTVEGRRAIMTKVAPREEVPEPVLGGSSSRGTRWTAPDA